jgi:excinuclease ABC subunit C
MVVFEQGTPAKNLYRHFNIKTVSGPDDFASMEEVLTRRFKRWQAAQEQHKVGEKIDPSFSVLPDLLMVDGGKGQLGRAVGVLAQFGLSEVVPVVGLAKQQEELFRPEVEGSLMLPRHSQGLYLIQRIRDEAHRFAITAHRKARGKIGVASRLDAIPGIGPQRRKALLTRFSSIDAIREASLEDLMSVSGITEEVALAVQAGLE